MNTRLSRTMAAVAVPALLLVAAACGDDDQSTDETTADTAAVDTTGAPATTAGGEADPAAFCQAVIDTQNEVNALNGPQGDPDALGAALDAVEAATPEEITDPLAVLVETGRARVAGDDEGGPAEDEYFDAVGEVTTWMSDNCGYESIDVILADYSFEGVPETIPAGPTVFSFVNEGAEEHEFVFFRINDDVTESVEELLMLPQEEVLSKVTFEGSSFASAGESSGAVADLAPGRYAAVCFIPVGSTPEAVAEATANSIEIQGPPHITQGMVVAFAVE